MLLKDKLLNHNVILASRSPRRKELLAGAGIVFVQAENYHVDEVYPTGMNPRQVPEYLASLKSREYPWRLAVGDILITADTVVICDDRILGKPTDRDSAVRMLRMLSGREHTVVTGVVLRDIDGTAQFSAASEVRFRQLSQEEIDYYVDTFAPFDKAGSYGIQEWIGYVAIESINGSFYNVMGLPVQALYLELDKFVGRDK